MSDDFKVDVKILKVSSSQRISEWIYNLERHWNMLDLQEILNNTFIDKVNVQLNVFGSSMKNQIMWQQNHAKIITKQGRLKKWNVKFLQN